MCRHPRRLLRSPGFTFATVATLALAIGVNVAIFTLVNGVVPESTALPGRTVTLGRQLVEIGLESTVGCRPVGTATRETTTCGD